MMFGYLNVFLAAAFMSHGMSNSAAIRLLDEREASAFTITDCSIRWRDYLLTARRDAFLKQFCRKILGYSLGP